MVLAIHKLAIDTSSLFWLALGTISGYIFIHALITAIRPQLKFIYHCFLRPLGATGTDQRSRLDKFYGGQADVYDSTRNALLKGRNTMLSMSAAHMRDLRAANPEKPLVWMDIGGGTGHNIEMMDKFMKISEFDKIYLIDLCEPLLNVARKRFEKRGWSNVVVLCQDASEFSLPEWGNGKDPKGSVGFITMSYSLSMIPSFYALLDRIDYVLDPDIGLVSVVDFYTAGKQSSLHEKAIGGTSKECGWLSRWFWQIWFEFDYVSLSPHRRNYLEYKFGTIKTYNGRNHFLFPFLVRIPYYIALCRSRSCDVSRFCHAFEVQGGNLIGNCSPVALSAVTETEMVPPLEIGEPALALEMMPSVSPTVIDITPPLSSFHYQVKNPWRLPYYEQPVHKEFRTFIYSFTWEDPFEDMKYLDIGRNDSMFVITSAGDNALHYAIAAKPRRIHCVDMNPCQGHLLELKLACIQSLPYDDFFSLFGQGCHPSFRSLLDSKISPRLSSFAYQFWRINEQSFTSSFYTSGYSGIALRLARFIFTLAGVQGDVERMCEADTTFRQEVIWREKIRPVLLNPVVVAVLKSPIFCWNALGVPMNQRNMILQEGSLYEFLRATFDPLPSRYLFKDGAYFYLLALLGHYTKKSCPLYLTKGGFDTLEENDYEALDAFRLHTDSIMNVLKGLSKWTLTRAIVMDHLDWFKPGSEEVEEEIAEFHRVLAPGAYIFWRSSGRAPWYNQVFEKVGFKITPLGVRPQDGNAPIDRVNMYASFWRGVRI